MMSVAALAMVIVFVDELLYQNAVYSAKQNGKRASRVQQKQEMNIC